MNDKIKISVKPEMVKSVNKQIEKYRLKKSVNHKVKESVIYKSPRKCSTKSQWQWKWETDADKMKKKYGEDKKDQKIKYKKAVILVDDDSCDAYEAEIEKSNGEIIVKIPCGKEKIKARVEKIDIDDEEIIKIALINNAEIYKLEEVIEDK